MGGRKLRKQTMRALSVLLCVLMTMSSFSVLTAFATENKTEYIQLRNQMVIILPSVFLLLLKS